MLQIKGDNIDYLIIPHQVKVKQTMLSKSALLSTTETLKGVSVFRDVALRRKTNIRLQESIKNNTTHMEVLIQGRVRSCPMQWSEAMWTLT